MIVTMLMSLLSRRRMFKHSIRLLLFLEWRRARHMFPVSPFLLLITLNGFFLSCLTKGFLLLTY